MSDVVHSAFVAGGGPEDVNVIFHPEGDYATKNSLEDLMARVTKLETQNKEQNEKIADLSDRLAISDLKNEKLLEELKELRKKDLTTQAKLRKLEKIEEKYREALDKIDGLEKRVKDFVDENADLKRKLSRLREGKPETKNWWRIVALLLLGGLVGAALCGGGVALFAGKAAVTAYAAGGGGFLGAVAGGVYGYKTS